MEFASVNNNLILKITESGKRDLNPRPSVWETDALPLSYSRLFTSTNLRFVVLIVKTRLIKRLHFT